MVTVMVLMCHDETCRQAKKNGRAASADRTKARGNPHRRNDRTPQSAVTRTFASGASASRSENKPSGRGNETKGGNGRPCQRSV